MYKEFNVDGAWVSGENGTIATVRRMMAKNNVLYSRMPVSVKGQLFDLQLKKAGKRLAEIKCGRDISKYGGYNNVKGTYFVLVEHMEKKKKVRSIEQLLLMDKNEYEKSPELYARKHWYADAKVIIPCIYTDALFEIDGIRLNITKRTNNQIGFKHAHQLVLDYDAVVMIKSISKYLGRYNVSKKDIYISEKDNVSKENNIKLYELFSEKLRNTIYKNCFPKSMLNYMDENKEKFIAMSILEQCKILLEILKAFKCDAQHPSFKVRLELF